MFRNNIFTVLLIGSLCAGVTTASAEVIFSDSFESGDMSTINADGFKWGGNNRTSVVIQDPADGSVKLWENGAAYDILSDLMPDGSDRDYTTNFGDKGLRFKYRALDSGASQPQWTEQRFDFGKGYPEIWFSYHIRVPLNYVRGPDGPSAGRNGKWMVLLMGNMSLYTSSNVCRVIVSDWPNAAQTGASLNLQIKNSGAFTGSEVPKYVDFITPADAGRWMEIVYHLKASSSVGAGDGIVKMYRKWEDESAFEFITGLENTDCDIGLDSIATGYLGWGGGYFMGWANDPYAEETEWLIDDITVSTTSLLPNPPLPPSKVTGAKTK